MPSTTSYQSQQHQVERHTSPTHDHPHHPAHHQQQQQQQQHHSYATTSTPQQYAAYYAAHHHQHPSLVEHPTDGTPLHDHPQSQQQQSLQQQQDQHPLVDSEGLAAAELLAAFPQSPAVDAASSPDVLPQQAAAALSAQEAASAADASHSALQQHHPSATAQAITLPFPPPGSVPIAYFAGPNGSIIAIPQLKAKRRQVKNACTNCQKACKKCDEVRPCTRCVKYGIDKDCVDSQRKERKKGIKRGPYKKREPKNKLTFLAASAALEQHEVDPEEEDPTLPQAGANITAAHIITPDGTTAFQIGGTVIYSYAPATMVQASGSGTTTNGNAASSSSSSNIPQSPTQQQQQQQPQASSSSSSSSANQQQQQHIQIQPAQMLPAQMQFPKAADGTTLQYPQQYYIATQPVVSPAPPANATSNSAQAASASDSVMRENANGDVAGGNAGSSASGQQQVQIQQHAFPLQYFGSMAYAGFQAGYVVQPPGSMYQIAPSSMQANQHANNDDPIERQNHHQGPLPPTLNPSPGNGGKGKGKSIESRKKVAAATLAAAQQEMDQRARAGGGPGDA